MICCLDYLISGHSAINVLCHIGLEIGQGKLHHITWGATAVVEIDNLFGTRQSALASRHFGRVKKAFSSLLLLFLPF
jgi:hypothetical protein